MSRDPIMMVAVEAGGGGGGGGEGRGGGGGYRGGPNAGCWLRVVEELKVQSQPAFFGRSAPLGSPPARSAGVCVCVCVGFTGALLSEAPLNMRAAGGEV